MRKWIAVAVLAAGLVVFGGMAVAQDAAPENPRQAQNAQQEKDRSSDHEGCRFGQENAGGDEV